MKHRTTLNLNLNNGTNARQIKNLLKHGILILGISLLLTDCQKDDSSNENQEHQIAKINHLTIDDLPEIANALSNIQGANTAGRSSRSMNTSFGELDLNDILEYVNSDGKPTYSFLINKNLDIENPYAFENLHMVKLQEGYLGYILRWEPNHEWFEANDFKFLLQHFTGKQLHYDLDYNLLQETNFVGGQVIVNEDSNRKGSRKQSKSMEMEIVCIEIVSDLCEYSGADYCGGSICGFGAKTSCYLAIVSGVAQQMTVAVIQLLTKVEVERKYQELVIHPKLWMMETQQLWLMSQNGHLLRF